MMLIKQALDLQSAKGKSLLRMKTLLMKSHSVEIQTMMELLLMYNKTNLLKEMDNH